jgi:hypothetical protein
MNREQIMNREQKDKYIIELVKERRGELYFTHIYCDDYFYSKGCIDLERTFEKFYKDPIKNKYIEEYDGELGKKWFELGFIMPIMYYLTLKHYNLFDLCLKENIFDYVDINAKYNGSTILERSVNKGIPIMSLHISEEIDEYYDDLRNGYYFNNDEYGEYEDYEEYDINDEYLKFVVINFLKHPSYVHYYYNILDGYLYNHEINKDIVYIILSYHNLDEKINILAHLIMNLSIINPSIVRSNNTLIREFISFLDIECKYNLFILEEKIKLYIKEKYIPKYKKKIYIEEKIRMYISFK